jgi:hypothetical protein
METGQSVAEKTNNGLVDRPLMNGIQAKIAGNVPIQTHPKEERICSILKIGSEFSNGLKKKKSGNVKIESQ